MRAPILICVLALLTAFSGVVFLQTASAGRKPSVQLKVDGASPRDVDDSGQQAIVGDYSSAWQDINTALTNNNTGPLNDNFVGFALDKLTQRVNDQQHNGLRTRIVDRGHKVEAIFYSLDGSAIELRYQATLETKILTETLILLSPPPKIHIDLLTTS